MLPFTAVFAAVSWLAGDPARGAALVLKSYLSALAVLLLVSTTPLPVLLRGFEIAGAPRFLLMVAQFLYRYLFVISEEAQHMRKAAAWRAAPPWADSAGSTAPLSGRGGSAGRAVRPFLRARRRDSPGHAGARLSGILPAFDASYTFTAATCCFWLAGVLAPGRVTAD